MPDYDARARLNFDSFGPVPEAILAFVETIFGLKSVASSSRVSDQYFDLAYKHFEELDGMLSATGKRKFRTLWNAWKKHGRYLSEENDTIPVYATDTEIAKLVSILERYGESGRLRSPRTGIMIARLRAQRRPGEQTRRAVIVSAASAIEVLFGSLVHELLLKAPGKASGEKEFTLADLLAYSNLDEVIETAIKRKVASLVGGGGLEDWSKWFAKKSPKAIDFASVSLDWSATQELFKRRNAIVHTNSRVNLDYHRSISYSPAEGTELSTSEEYVDEALGNLLLLGILVGLQTWLWSEQPNGDLWWALAETLADDLWEHQNYGAAGRLYKFLRNHGDDLDLRLEAKVREWSIALWLQGTSDESSSLIEQISNWNAGELGDKWAFRKAVLLRDFDSAFLLLPGLIGAGDVMAHDLTRFGYDGLRQDPRFEDVVGPLVHPRPWKWW
jgi:hypothetical protein